MASYSPFVEVGFAINVWILLHVAAAVLSVLCDDFIKLLEACVLFLEGPLTFVGPHYNIISLFRYFKVILLGSDVRSTLAGIYVAFFDFLFWALWRIGIFALVVIVIRRLIQRLNLYLLYVSIKIHGMVVFDIAMPISSPLEIEHEKEMRELDDLIKEFQKVDSAGGTWRLWRPRKKAQRKRRRKIFNGKQRSCRGRRFWSHSPRKQRRRGFRRVQARRRAKAAKTTNGDSARETKAADTSVSVSL